MFAKLMVNLATVKFVWIAPEQCFRALIFLLNINDLGGYLINGVVNLFAQISTVIYVEKVEYGKF